MWADAQVTQFIGGKPLSEEEAWGKFLRTFGQWMVMGFGFWSVVERTTGKRVGEVGFVEGRRQIIPSLNGVPECGWSLATHAHGLHYRTGKRRFASSR